MKQFEPPAYGKPILATDPKNPRINWWIPAGGLAACVVIVLMFLSTPGRSVYRPYFVAPGAVQIQGFDPDSVLDTASIRDLAGGAR